MRLKACRYNILRIFYIYPLLFLYIFKMTMIKNILSDVNRREVMSDIISEEYEPMTGVSWHAMDAGPTFVP